jgi:para-nitrobenzyl esterase
MRARFLLTAIASAATICGQSIAQAGPVVATVAGKVQGRTAEGVNAFLGISYGADTGGANRFQPPEPAAPWQGVRPATAMGSRCPQSTGTVPLGLIRFSDAPVSEDCLNLNVWTPKADRAKRPVMVWLHGGGFGFGSANDPWYDGAGLARHEDVVVVSLNHRLNGFGYLDLGTGAADVGQLDIVQALRWVQANIARFGGDPENVTIFGQSGGGAKIAVLLAMPTAKGLFQKAIIESGAMLHVDAPQAALAQRDKVLAAAGLKPNEMDKLRSLPMQELIAAFDKAGVMGFKPWVDGTVLPRQPFTPDAPTVSRDVALLIGTSHDEATDIAIMSPLWPKLTEDQMRMMIAPLVGPQRVDRAIALYRAREPGETPPQLYASVLTDYGFTHNTAGLATRKATSGGAPVYVYRTDWKSPVLDGVLRAPHGVELPFLFDTVDKASGLVGQAAQPGMVAQFQRSFAAFARSGKPGWPAYSAANRVVHLYDVKPGAVTDPDADLRRFWDEASGDRSEPIVP